MSATRTRAKFVCQSATTYGNTDAVSYTFQAQYDPTIEEDRRFSRATPTGKLEIYVDNPAVTFEKGRAYYLDLTPADDPAPNAPS